MYAQSSIPASTLTAYSKYVFLVSMYVFVLSLLRSLRSLSRVKKLAEDSREKFEAELAGDSKKESVYEKLAILNIFACSWNISQRQSQVCRWSKFLGSKSSFNSCRR